MELGDVVGALVLDGMIYRRPNDERLPTLPAGTMSSCTTSTFIIIVIIIIIIVIIVIAPVSCYHVQLHNIIIDVDIAIVNKTTYDQDDDYYDCHYCPSQLPPYGPEQQSHSADCASTGP